MKANERARKLEKSANSIFINALAYWFQWIQVYFPILSNPASCIELCRVGERISKSHSQCLSLIWPLWCSMSHFGQGTQSHWIQFPQMQNGDIGGTHLIRLLGGWTTIRYTCQVILRFLTFPLCAHTFPQREFYPSSQAQFKHHFSRWIVPWPTSDISVSYLLISCGLSSSLPWGSLWQS